MSTLTKEKLLHHTILRENFMAFCEQCFYLLHKQRLMVNYHHRLLTCELEECRLADAYNLVINMPPRELKSEITSIFHPIWLLAHSKKNLDSLIFTRSKKLGKLFLHHIASLLQEELIEIIFPDLRLDSYYDRLETAKGRITILSTNSLIIGLGGDVIIIDDPISVSEANDIAKVRSLNKWFSTELLSRLNNKSEDKIILLMQRLHRFDLSAYMLHEKKDCKHLSLEAIATKDQTYNWQEWSVLERKFIEKKYQRAKGKTLNEARDSLASMKKLQKEISDKFFEAQYQQEPKLTSYEDIVCKSSNEHGKLTVKEACLAISLNTKGNKASFLTSLQEKGSNKVTLIDYKVETFISLQLTIDAYVKELLENIDSSNSIAHHFSRLHVVIILAEPNHILSTDELQKFRKSQFRYSFTVLNKKEFIKHYQGFKNCLYTADWQSGMTLAISDRGIKKELVDSLNNYKIDNFFKLVILSFMVHHNYK